MYESVIVLITASGSELSKDTPRGAATHVKFSAVLHDGRYGYSIHGASL